MNILFLGTADFALPSLKTLLDSPHRVIAVITQPDRAKGRGQKLTPSPVKTLALTHHLPIYQPEKIRDPASLRVCQGLKPDLLVVAAYGQILPKALLLIAPRGCVNVHASLLPRFRGAAPIARAILAGEERTGVTTMLMDEGMDTGPILLTEEVPIHPQDTMGTLHDRLSEVGARLLAKTMEGLVQGTLTARPQDPTLASYAPKVLKEEGRIDWNQDAFQLSLRIRALDPCPGAFTFLSGRMLKLFSPQVAEGLPGFPGTVLKGGKDELWVATGRGSLGLRELQLENRPRMPAKEFLKGHRLPPGTPLGT